MSSTVVTPPLIFLKRAHVALKMAFHHFLLWLQGRNTDTYSDISSDAGYIIRNMTENASDNDDMLLMLRTYITESERKIISLRRQFRVYTTAIIILLLLLP